MSKESVESGHGRGMLTLMRFLAAILLCEAACCGVAVVASIGMALDGKVQNLAILPFAVFFTWMFGWLGTRLWAGRSIPQWFISAFLGSLVVGCLGLSLNLMTGR